MGETFVCGINKVVALAESHGAAV